MSRYDNSNPRFPQTWNRYAYVGGTPLELLDEDGLCPTGTRAATTAEANAAIQVAETYVNQGVTHASGTHWQAGRNGSIDCSGLMMCALGGVRYPPSPFPSTYLGLNLTTSNIDQWTDPGTGAVGDIVYFASPGHVGIVTGPNTFIGSQSKYGVKQVSFGPQADYWGNPAHTSAPVFRRACVADQQTTTSGGGGGNGGGNGGGDIGGGGGGGGITGNLVDILRLWFDSIWLPGYTITTTTVMAPKQ